MRSRTHKKARANTDIVLMEHAYISFSTQTNELRSSIKGLQIDKARIATLTLDQTGLLNIDDEWWSINDFETHQEVKRPWKSCLSQNDGPSIEVSHLRTQVLRRQGGMQEDRHLGPNGLQQEAALTAGPELKEIAWSVVYKGKLKWHVNFERFIESNLSEIWNWEGTCKLMDLSVETGALCRKLCESWLWRLTGTELAVRVDLFSWIKPFEFLNFRCQL